GCLIGCENNVQAAANLTAGLSSQDLATIASGDACASSQSHDCCAKRNAGTKSASHHSEQIVARALVPSGQRSSGTVGRCPLAVNATAVIAKVRYQESAALAAAVPAQVPPARIGEQSFPLPPQTRLANRGHTYLCCCVFLI
ncbi:MAG: hypothetical protein ACRD6N_11400, partial [Pyrinomonadaceae bacterium]